MCHIYYVSPRDLAVEGGISLISCVALGHKVKSTKRKEKKIREKKKEKKSKRTEKEQKKNRKRTEKKRTSTRYY